VLCTTLSFAQTNSYYYKGVKKEVKIDRKLVNIIVKNDFAKTSISNLNAKEFEIKETENANEKIATIEFVTEPTEMEYLQKVNALKNNPNVIAVAPFYKNGKYKSVGTSNLFMVQLKTPSDSIYLKEFANSKNVIAIKKDDFMPDWWYLKTTRATATNAVETANLFYQTNSFAEIDPSFMIAINTDGTPSNNATVTNATVPGCAGNWGIYNTTNPNLDTNACQAWTLSEGDNIKVAVIDTGIKKTHPFLLGNIDLTSFNPLTNISSSVINYHPQTGAVLSHGQHVGGIIGANNNNGQVTGIAPKCKLQSVSDDLFPGFAADPHSHRMARGINWASNPSLGNSQVLNCSWYAEVDDSGIVPTFLDAAITNAITLGLGGKGAVVVFCSGNEGFWGNQGIMYPAMSSPYVLCVGNMDQTGQRGNTSCYGDELDLVAPGTDILSTIIPATGPHTQNTDLMTGTSMAAPFVSGTAALILKVNPCVSGKQVRDYIESTCQKVGGYDYQLEANRPNGTRHIEMGYGLLDAYAATKMAQNGYKPTYDLYIKDFYTDAGKEPSTNTGFATNSPDIWIRNVDDGIDFDQPAVVKNTPNFVYVRVRNKSCVNTPPNTNETNYQLLKLYISRPSAANQDPTSRMRNPLANDNFVLVGSQSIPSIPAGEDVILKFPWTAPITWVPAGGHLVNVNLMAQIESNLDPMASPLGAIAYNNTVKNNNIASKNNIQVYYDYFNDNGGHFPERVVVSNPFDEAHSFRLELVKEVTETGKAIYEEAEVNIKMDDVLYNAWQRGGKVEQNLEQTADAKKQIVENNHVLIDNIQLNPLEQGSVTIDFSFLAKEATDKRNFKYHIVQRDLATNEIIGVETYNINKKPRPVFEADAGDDKEKDRNETITISARQISEPAIYNWYDTDGNLIFTGKNLTVANDVAKKYKLEVIATSDGFKDYSEVEVKLKPSTLNAIAPNPATDAITIGYKINEGGSAYLMILGGYGTNSASNNYIINPELGEININLANYSNGFYTVALVVNGHIIYAKTLLKE
jgi:serine protease